MDAEYYCTSGEVTGEKDVGRGVARVMLGKSIFRGTIQKVISSILSASFEQLPCTLLTIFNALRSIKMIAQTRVNLQVVLFM